MRRLREKMIFNFAQFAFAILFAGCLEVSGPDKRPNASPGFDYAKSFEFGVDLGDGVCVYAQVNCQLSDGRELIAHGELSGCD